LAETIRVLSTHCPFWQKVFYELWDGHQPLVSANNYLRSELVLSDNTLADKAYSLAMFFRFLRRNSIDFFELTQSTLTPIVLHFRNELLFRVRQGDGIPNSIDSSRAVRALGYPRARSILSEVGALCEWWGLVKIRAIGKGYGFRGTRWSATRIRSHSLPDCFQIRVPKMRKTFRENHALEISEIENIWNYVTSESRPPQPRILTNHPTGPKRGWSSSKSLAWKESQRHYKKRIAWFHRQQMLWALLFGSAMRRGEVPLLMLGDVQFYGEDLWVNLRLRKLTEPFGWAKTGPRSIFIGWDHRIITAWQNWSRSRRVLVDFWRRTSGKADHGMFLTNQNGGPLTVDGISSLIDTLNSRFGFFGGEFPEDQFKLHPHAIRHTVDSLFKVWKIPRDIRQRHLGHKKPETTDLYGKVYRRVYVGCLSELQEAPGLLNEKS
jgi:integrase